MVNPTADSISFCSADFVSSEPDNGFDHMTSKDKPIEIGAMSVDSFAKWAGIGRTTAWNEIRNGRLRAIKVNARTLVAFTEAQCWLSNLPDARSK